MSSVFALLTAFALGGCVAYQPKPLDPAVTAARLESRSLAEPGLKEFLERAGATLPAANWNFDQLTLAALYFNPSLAVAREQWHGAEAAITTAGGRLNPVLSLSPGYNFSAASGVTPWIPGFSLDIPIETAGKRKHRIERATAMARQARLALLSSAWQVRTKLRAAALGYVASHKRADLLAVQSEMQERIVRNLESRLSAGAASASEVTATRLALARTRSELSDAQRVATVGAAELANAIGVPTSALSGLKIQFPDLATESAPASPELRRRVLTNHVEVLAALSEYASAQASLQVEIAKQYPDIHLGPGYQYDQGDSKWTLGISAEIPAFNRNQGPIAEALSHREEAAAKLSAVQSKVLGELEAATALVRASATNFQSLQAVVVAQQDLLARVHAQLDAGAADRLELQGAELELAVAEILLNEGRNRVIEAEGRLEDAVQAWTIPPSALEPRPEAAVEPAKRP
jgi:outer membrane protein TolC